MTSIDLNCDLGEIPELIADGTDDALMEVVSSANIACGSHAGDAASMERTIRSAMRHRVAIGAHPSYPDRAGFGRTEVPASPDEVEAFVYSQISELDRIARALGARLVHVKPHGALYHAAGKDAAIAQAIGRAAVRVRGDLILVGLARSPMLASWRAAGWRVAAEAFADRAYEPGGGLRSRTHADALITDPGQAAAQALGIAEGRGVAAHDGSTFALRADTICLHGDTPGSVTIALAVRARLEEGGVAIRPLSGLKPR